MRLFKDEPMWTPLNRGKDTDINEHRKQYLQSRKVAAAGEEDDHMT
jgi:cupin superfamily acireductone dioxygenase involved in methionine salvage